MLLRAENHRHPTGHSVLEGVVGVITHDLTHKSGQTRLELLINGCELKILYID